MPEREYVVLEEWTSYIEVVVMAPNKGEALTRAKAVLHDESDEGLALQTVGHPTGRYEVRRAGGAAAVRGSDSLLPWRESLREVEADGLPGTKHLAESGSLSTLCGLTDLYPVVGTAIACADCDQVASGRTGGAS